MSRKCSILRYQIFNTWKVMLGNFMFSSWQQQEVIWQSSAFSTAAPCVA